MSGRWQLRCGTTAGGRSAGQFGRLHATRGFVFPAGRHDTLQRVSPSGQDRCSNRDTKQADGLAWLAGAPLASTACHACQAPVTRFSALSVKKGG